jgi:hypothetical protein
LSTEYLDEQLRQSNRQKRAGSMGYWSLLPGAQPTGHDARESMLQLNKLKVPGVKIKFFLAFRSGLLHDLIIFTRSVLVFSIRWHILPDELIAW